MYVYTSPRFCLFGRTLTDTQRTEEPGFLLLSSFYPPPICHATLRSRLPLLVIAHSILHLFPVYISIAAVLTDLHI